MFNLFLAVSPEIFIINATFILLIHGVVFSTSKKDDYPPLVSNVGWLGLLSVARLPSFSHFGKIWQYFLMMTWSREYETSV